MTQMNLSVKQKQNHRHKRLVLAKGERVEGEMKLEIGVSRYQLLFMEWINNKVLLYSTENHIQYPMINQKEKNFLMYIYV